MILGEFVLGGGPLLELEEDITIEEALLAKVQELTGMTRVFYGRNPRGPEELPCVVIEKESEEREDCFDIVAVNIPYMFQLRVWSLSPSTTVTISKTIRDGLDGLSGIMAGRYVAYVSFEGMSDDVRNPGDGSENWVYGRSLTFQIISEDE